MTQSQTPDKIPQLYQRTFYIFRKINPSKRYAEFSYIELDAFADVNVGFCSKGEVIKIKNDYYEYSKENTFATSNEKLVSKIVFKDRAKIITELEA